MIGLAEARELKTAVTTFADGFVADAVPLPDVVAMWDEVVSAQRQLDAIKTASAPRVEESRACQHSGHRSAAEFMAERSGTSVASARTQLDVACKVEEFPSTAQALRSGELSGAHVALVVEGASVNPAAEQRLLEQARRGSLKELREEVLRVRAAADPSPDASQQRIHSRRHFRTWRDAEGAWRASVYGTALAGARSKRGSRK